MRPWFALGCRARDDDDDADENKNNKTNNNNLIYSSRNVNEIS
jgi:hypothetical protein